MVGLDMKHCPRCHTDKPFEDFNKSTRAKDGLQPRCRECERVYRDLNKEHIKQRAKVYGAVNREKKVARDRERRLTPEGREKVIAYQRKWRADPANRERTRAHARRRSKSAKGHAYRKRYEEANREHIRVRKRDYMRKRRAESPEVVIRTRLSVRIRALLKSDVKHSSTLALLGCSIPEFRVYIEQRFTEGMSWERFMKGHIHIDHVKPCCSFDLLDPEQQKICFHHTNLQPLWAPDNRKKIAQDLLMKRPKVAKTVSEPVYQTAIAIT